MLCFLNNKVPVFWRFETRLSSSLIVLDPTEISLPPFVLKQKVEPKIQADFDAVYSLGWTFPEPKSAFGTFPITNTFGWNASKTVMSRLCWRLHADRVSMGHIRAYPRPSRTALAHSAVIRVFETEQDGLRKCSGALFFAWLRNLPHEDMQAKNTAPSGSANRGRIECNTVLLSSDITTERNVTRSRALFNQ
jgi:hypothetical protein